MEVTRKDLGSGVFLTYLPASKFKTSILSAQFVAPLRADTAPAYALIPSVLRRGTASCPDMGKLAARLDSLYGARLEPTVRKVGERQCVGFAASLLDDRFVPGGERLLEPVASLMGEMIISPVTRSGRFLPDYYESEKTNLLDAIRSVINDKRDWAAKRLMEEMCAGEAYGIPRLGDEEKAEALDPAGLYAAYLRLISTARLELLYCGGAPLERVEAALDHALAALPRRPGETLSPAKPHPAREDVLEVTDRMDVTQGKLGMGFSCASEDHTAMLMGNMLFGGSSNAKLFMNVREKLSLCYYASSVFHRQKNMITVSSGIEFDNYQRAFDEIMDQLDAVRSGDWEEWEMESARSAVLNSYASLGDSQGKLENFYLSQAALDLRETPESLAQEAREVTEERIRKAMGAVKLDTVYFLTGKEAAE